MSKFRNAHGTRTACGGDYRAAGAGRLCHRARGARRPPQRQRAGQTRESRRPSSRCRRPPPIEAPGCGPHRAAGPARRPGAGRRRRPRLCPRRRHHGARGARHPSGHRRGNERRQFRRRAVRRRLSGPELRRVAMQFEQSSITDWSLPARGLFKGQAAAGLRQPRGAPAADRAAADRKLAIVATDLGSGEMMVFERGNVGMAVRASSSVPGFFQPVEINGHEYVDGGLVSPVPVRTARRLGADVVIAVDMSKKPAPEHDRHVRHLAADIHDHGPGDRANRAAKRGRRPAPGLGRHRQHRLHARESSMQEGEQAVAAQAGAIEAKRWRARASPWSRRRCLANP
jgi:predicted acylesterase/phospholipase RssA